MAKVKPSDWVLAKDMFEAGKSLGDIFLKTNIDKAAISRKSKAEGWQKGINQQLILDAARVREEMSTLSSTALDYINKEVDERTKHVEFFNKAAITNVKQAMADVCEGQQDYKARAETINKGRETVLGKTPDTAVQVNVGFESVLKRVRVD